MSRHTLSRLVALAGIGATIGLVGHFMVAPPPTSFTSQSVLQAAASQQNALLTSAWLQGLGVILMMATALGVVELAGRSGSLAGRFVLLGGAAAVAHSLLSDTLVVAAAQLSAGGSGVGAATMLQIAHAADYGYPFINLVWVTALGVIVLRSRVLPQAFGYVALAFGALELVGGLAALYSDAVDAVVNPVYLVMVLWIVAAAIVLTVRSFQPATQTQKPVAA